ncbi:MAG: 7TM diverse intracellular signaling domain-containing protein [Bdellovibrionia bacterium]
MSKYLASLFTAVFCVFAHAWAAPAPAPRATLSSPVEITSSFTSLKLDPYVDAWDEGTNGKSPQDFLHAKPERTGEIRFGYVKKPVWLRFGLKNSAPSARDLVLTIDPPLVDELTLTEMTSSGQVIRTVSFAYRNRVAAGALFRRKPTFMITALPQEETYVILRLDSTHSLDVHLSLATPAVESQTAVNDNLAMGAYYGIWFVILVLNILVYLATLDRLYLIYAGFLLMLGIQLPCLNGFLDFAYEGSFIFSRHMASWSAAVLILAHLFTRDFLQTRIYVPKLDRIHLLIVLIAAVIGVLHFTPLYHGYAAEFGHAIDLTISLSLLLILTSTLIVFKKGYQPAKFFLIAWGMFLGMIALYYSATYGLIRGSSFTHYAIQIGSSVEMILLTIALGNRVYLLKEAKNEAEKKARETDNLRSLIHVICHDLRNPLTVISGLAQSYSQRGQKEWNPIMRAVQIQQEILDYVRLKEAIQLGKHRLEMVPVSISEAAENARFVFDRRIQEKKLQWHCEIEDGCSALADRTLLIHTVIANLVSNAVKFTPPGGRIDIQAYTLGKKVQIEVRDSGIGIPSQLLPHLFSSNAITTRLGTEGERGNGFGMPLVKTVVESFGGTLTVQSISAEEAGDGAITGTRMILSLKQA